MPQPRSQTNKGRGLKVLRYQAQPYVGSGSIISSWHLSGLAAMVHFPLLTLEVSFPGLSLEFQVDPRITQTVACARQ